MNDQPFPLRVRVAVLTILNLVLWLALFRLGQAARYFIFG